MALKFHKLRNANPQLFFHRNVNKGVYGAFGMLVHWLLAINQSSSTHQSRTHNSCASVSQSAVTGENLERVPVVITLDNDKPQSISGLESVIVCNIASYAGGTNLWGSSSDFAEPRFDDGQLEVMGITGYESAKPGPWWRALNDGGVLIVVFVVVVAAAFRT